MGASLAVQWLGLCAFTAGVWVRPLVGELRSRMLHHAAKKKKKKKLEKLIKIKVKISRKEEIIEEGQKSLKWKADK